TVTFIRKTAAYVDDLFQRTDATTADLQIGVQFGYTTVPHLSGVEILGPYNVSGPASAAEEPACAKRIVSTLARRAYRRPVTEGDVESLMTFYRAGRDHG